MIESNIETILSFRYVAKVGKYIVKLAFRDEKAREVWMTEKQLSQLETCFSYTPNGYSTERVTVVGCWNDRGYYAYAHVERQKFEAPPEQNLEDLHDTED